jgi:hypothetical protein
MAKINFPDSPTVDQIFEAGGKKFVWDGEKWNDVSPFDPADIGAAAASHTHDIDDINATGTPSSSNYLRGDGAWDSDVIAVPNGKVWKLIRDISTSTDFTQCVVGTSIGSITVTETLSDGDVLAIEMNSVATRTSTPKIVMVTVDNNTTSPGNSSEASTGWVSGDDTTLTFYSVNISANGTSVYFNNAKETNSADISSEVNASLYAGRVWRLV